MYAILQIQFSCHHDCWSLLPFGLPPAHTFYWLHALSPLPYVGMPQLFLSHLPRLSQQGVCTASSVPLSVSDSSSTSCLYISLSNHLSLFTHMVIKHATDACKRSDKQNRYTIVRVVVARMPCVWTERPLCQPRTLGKNVTGKQPVSKHSSPPSIITGQSDPQHAPILQVIYF